MARKFTPAIDHTHLPRPQIAMQPCVSSKFTQLGYCPQRQELVVRFNDTALHVYHYPDFSQDDHDRFMSAESLGRHFGEHIASRTSHKYLADSAQTEQTA
jgi:hypothetical protein